MRFSLRRWRPRHLLLSWLAYWIALVAVRLGDALVALSHVLALPEGRGSFSLSYDDAFRMNVVDSGRAVWSGSASLGELALWVAGPPLLLFALWLLARPRRGEATATEPTRAAIGEPPFEGVRAEQLDRDESRVEPPAP